MYLHVAAYFFQLPQFDLRDVVSRTQHLTNQLGWQGLVSPA